MLNLVKLINVLTLVSTVVDIGSAIVPKVTSIFKKKKVEPEPEVVVEKE